MSPIPLADVLGIVATVLGVVALWLGTRDAERNRQDLRDLSADIKAQQHELQTVLGQLKDAVQEFKSKLNTHDLMERLANGENHHTANSTSPVPRTLKMAGQALMNLDDSALTVLFVIWSGDIDGDDCLHMVRKKSGLPERTIIEAMDNLDAAGFIDKGACALRPDEQNRLATFFDFGAEDGLSLAQQLRAIRERVRSHLISR